MSHEKYLNFLEKEIGASVFSTTDNEGKVHSRYLNVGVGDANGVFFMTTPQTDLYKQLQENQNIAVVGSKVDGDGFRVIRIEGEVRPLGKDKLEEILEGNPYVQDVYPNEEDRETAQAFQIYKGVGNYHHLQDKVKEDFSWNAE